MVKHQRNQKPELANSVISRTSSLLAFKPADADANMCRSNHINIISAIPDRQCLRVRMLQTNHYHDFSFLFWAYPARKNHRCLVDQVNEFTPQRIIGKYFDQTFTCHDDPHLLAFFSDVQVLLVLSDTDLLIDADCFRFIDNILVEFGVK